MCVCIPVYRSTDLPTYPTYLSIYLSVYILLPLLKTSSDKQHRYLSLPVLTIILPKPRDLSRGTLC